MYVVDVLREFELGIAALVTPPTFSSFGWTPTIARCTFMKHDFSGSEIQGAVLAGGNRV